jgi:hypothetical protein
LQNALRAIGRYFDVNVFRHILVAQVDGGFIARVFSGPAGHLKAQGIDFPTEDVLTLIAAQRQSGPLSNQTMQSPPLCPTGYEDFFRALGYELETLGADKIRLVELSAGILVAYTSTDPNGAAVRSEKLFDLDLIDQALTRGYMRRGKAYQPRL